MLFNFSKVAFLFLFLFSAGFFFVPSSAMAANGLIPCGRSQDDSTTSVDERQPCTICHIVVGGKGLIDWGLNLMTVIAITILFAMAVLYVISAGDEGMMGTAKGGIKAALIGFAVMLSAWLIVNVILTVLADTNDTSKPLGGLVSNGAFKFQCDTKSNIQTK